MNFVSVGDLARSFHLRRQSASMKQQLDQLSLELSTGKKADWAAETGGDYTSVAAIEHDLAALSSFQTANTEASVMAETMQTTLESISSMSQDAGASLISTLKTASDETIDAATTDAKQKFLSAVSALNTSVGGRFVMSGAATDTAPLISGEDMLTALDGVVSGLTGTQDVAQAVSDWFDAPAGGGGFLDTAYQGSDVALGAIPVSARDQADLSVTAADSGIRGTLKGLAMAALVADGLFAGDTEERGRMAREAGSYVLSAQSEIVSTQARLGVQQELISDATTRNDAETAALTIAKSEIAEADPYETATAIEAVQSQIEALYTITARLSNLNLSNYLS